MISTEIATQFSSIEWHWVYQLHFKADLMVSSRWATQWTPCFSGFSLLFLFLFFTKKIYEVGWVKKGESRRNWGKMRKGMLKTAFTKYSINTKLKTKPEKGFKRATIQWSILDIFISLLPYPHYFWKPVLLQPQLFRIKYLSILKGFW